MKVAFELLGEMPLLMHNDDVEASDRLKEWRQDSANKNRSVAGDDRSPAWTWQTYCYHDGEKIALPSQNLMVALRQAGAQLILKKQKTYKEISQSGLLIASEFLDFRCAGKPLSVSEAMTDCFDMKFSEQAAHAQSLGFRLFVKRAKVGQAKHVRVRPRFDQWSASGTIQILASEISYETLSKLFELAGRVGLGDWRPGCKTPGPFGMFTTKLRKV